MTTAVCKAANILGMREEHLNELLVLINMTSGTYQGIPESVHSPRHYALMTDSLVDEYSQKC